MSAEPGPDPAPDRTPDRVGRARRLTGPEDTRALYDDWAADYDAELLGAKGYVGPVETAKVVAEALPDRTAALLDIGCGTGLVGAALAGHGFSAIDGVDLSPAMLERARAKGVYRRLFAGDLLAGLDLPDHAYDAAVGVGVFSVSHIAVPALDELLRLVRPGGRIVPCIRLGPGSGPGGGRDDGGGFLRRFEVLESAGRLRILARRRAPYMRPPSEQAAGDDCEILVLEPL
ncbi:Methyltransferase domain-containing protein [Tistlia consotensis]|uniref:Methyltransferase domain-containing protein n=1 Tax=Tistlia consotensis USBA 355 TaxID=560819 RepID=A0A1Y6C3C7_9PROT|nr:class I SAM-dependent methyltransferase [Tistlia consotensis]SMF43293.1 Methyltransferase domain-containing protein [Tistlia consotensis USBA 355]SNR42429.1 Methyltransferase domain-containing protein [Tistlia consotensis]